MAKGYHPLRRSSDPVLKRSYSETNINYSLPFDSRITMSYIPLNNMAIPIYTAPPTREDVEIGGRVLFQRFIQEELHHEGIPEEILEVENPPNDVFDDVGPEVMQGDGEVADRAASPAFVIPADGYKTAKFIEIGANIRSIADKFAKSDERAQIRHLSDEVDLRDIAYSTFHHMLSELFRNGINKYKIVSLFYFCSDVVIRCVKNEYHRLGSKLFFWALEFLVSNVCTWVRAHGGWGRVFSDLYTVVYNTALLTALGVAICCGFVWMKNNM